MDRAFHAVLRIRRKTGVTGVSETIKSIKWQWTGHITRTVDNRWDFENIKLETIRAQYTNEKTTREMER